MVTRAICALAVAVTFGVALTIGGVFGLSLAPGPTTLTTTQTAITRTITTTSTALTYQTKLNYSGPVSVFPLPYNNRSNPNGNAWGIYGLALGIPMDCLDYNPTSGLPPNVNFTFKSAPQIPDWIGNIHATVEVSYTVVEGLNAPLDCSAKVVSITIESASVETSTVALGN